MNLHALCKDDNLFWEALLLSLGLHALVSFKAGEFTLQYQQKHTVEIDITNMGYLGMSGPTHKPAAPPSAPKPAPPVKEWVKPSPNQKVVPASIPIKPVVVPAPKETPPTPSASATNETGRGEYSIGAGDGNANMLSRIPQLLNLSDLNVILQRFYPEEERAASHEGTVVLDLHIDADGHVAAVDIVQSAGSDFDEAARRAAKLLRFTPAFLGSQRVAVKMRQAIQFKLER